VNRKATRTKASTPKERLRTASFICYSGEPPAELFSYPPRGQYDVLVQGFREGIQRKAVQKGERSLSSQERVVLAVTALEDEVNNGGYDQFLRNQSRKLVPIVVDCLMQIGLLRQAKITQKAIDALHLRTINVRAIDAAMAKSSDERDNRLEECDRSFYKTQQGAARKLYLFLKTNRAHIKF
jgi:hypothetical protein